MTTYYVSSIIGSDKNAGTSGSAPLASLQAAENLVKPGDTVEVMNGTYTGPGGGNVLTISTSGTASAPITFEAAPGATPVIDSSGTWQAIELDASYITIKGLTIVGDAANYNLSSAMAGYSTGNPDLNGNAIAATSGKLIHHIIIENNTIYNEPGAGIGINNGDYLQILNNNVHDNAHWSAYGASGISIGASQNFDNGPGPHIIITGNTSVNNAELVPEYRANAITDGEGIILDSNSGYTGGFLVQNNTTHGNSGPGIESFHSDNAVITGNTATGDLTNPNLVGEGEIFINQSNNNTVSNNITTAAPPPPPSGQLITNGSFETHDFGGWTLGGNSGPSTFGPQFFIDTTPVNGTYAAGLGSMGSDGTLSQTIATTAGKTYTLSFWLQNGAPGANDFKATWNGQTLVSLTNAAQSGYKQYTYSVTATGSASTLQFSARNDPSRWDLDNISLTASGASSTPPPPPPPTTPTITRISESPATGALNAGKTVTLTLGFSSAVTVAGKPTLTLNDGGTATYASGSGTSALTFSYTVAAGQNVASLAATAVNLASGATIKNSAGAAANLSLTGLTQSGPQIDTTAPAAPAISGDTVSGNVVKLSGTAEANSTITVFDNSTRLGTATTSSGAWTFTTGALASGSQSFTATATDGAGNVSRASSALGVTLPASGGTGGGSTGANLVANGSFETSGLSGWTLGGNSGASAWGPQIFIDTHPESGAHAAAMGSMGTDGTLSQTIATTAGKTYTLSFWLQNEAAGANDFKATWNGQTLVSLTDAAQSGYKQYTYSVTATGSASTLQFSARNDPKQWDLDNVSLTASGASSTPPPPPASGGTGGGSTGANLVANGSFETSGLSGWTLGGNSGASAWGPQIFIDTHPESGAHAAAMGSVGTDGTLSQTIATTAGKTYTLSFWLQNEAAGANDFKATWNGQTLVSLTDAAQSGYKQYTYSVTATGPTSTLVFSARNDPKQWDLDNVSVVAAPAGASVNSSPVVNSSASLAVNTPTVTTQTKVDGSYDVVHSNVTGLSYSSYEDIFSSTGAQLAEARDMIGGAGTLLLNADDLLVSSSSGSLAVTTGSDTFKLNPHTSESIIASGRSGETFEFGAGFGHESITGLLAGGPSSDVIEFPVTMFKGLSSTNTATQNWNALLSSGAAVQSGANVTITNPAQDVLTLNNVTTSMLSNHASEVFKFA